MEEDLKFQPLKAQPTSREANHVLWAFSAGGYPPGGFVTLLIEAIQTADPQNRMRLSLGFLGYVKAVHMAQHEENGIEKLKEIASKP